MTKKYNSRYKNYIKKHNHDRLFVLKKYSTPQRLNGYIWEFKLGDRDDHPSVPHGHSKEGGLRLDAWSGEIYPSGNERMRVIGKLASKELSRLHKDPKFIKFARKQIAWYQSEYPYIKFYVPDWLKLKSIQAYSSLFHKEDKVSVYRFYGKANINR